MLNKKNSTVDLAQGAPPHVAVASLLGKGDVSNNKYNDDDIEGEELEFHSKTLYDACSDLKSDMFMVSIFSWGITFVIIFVNFLMGRITYALI